MFNDIVNHIRNRPYMHGIERDRLRIKQTEEIFTPTLVVQQSLDILERVDAACFEDLSNTFLDNSCGDGQFLGEVIIRKMENGSTFKQALQTTYGVDLMQDNVDLCRERLLCGHEELRHIVEQNIVCADALEYDYSFDGSYEKKQAKVAELDSLKDSLFDFGD